MNMRTVGEILQIALENKQAMDEAMRSADRSHQAKRRFAETPADPSAWGHLTERSGECVQAPDGKTEYAEWEHHRESFCRDAITAIRGDGAITADGGRTWLRITPAAPEPIAAAQTTHCASVGEQTSSLPTSDAAAPDSSLL